MNPADGERAGDMVAVLSLPHYGETRDIAGMVAFLAGPDGRYVTGASLAVDGDSRPERKFLGATCTIQKALYNLSSSLLTHQRQRIAAETARGLSD